MSTLIITNKLIAQNVKSVVWPPPNPPEDEPPKRELSPVKPTISVPQMVNTFNNETVQTGNMQQSKKQTETCQQQEISTNISSTSATSSSMTASSSKSESVRQSHQSQIVQETSSCSVKSFSQESSSESQSMMVYQSGSCPIVRQSFDNSSKTESILNANIADTKQVEQSTTLKQTSEIEKTSKQVNFFERDNTSLEVTSTKNEPTAENSVQEVSIQDSTKKYEQNEDIVCTKLIDNQSYSGESTVMESQSTVGLKTDDNIKMTSDSFTKESNNYEQVAHASMLDALTTASDRPFSPLPAPQEPVQLSQSEIVEDKQDQYNPDVNVTQPVNPQPTSQQMSMFNQQPKREISPIPPIKQFNPSHKPQEPVPMPPETKPYIPPDFKINVEPKTTSRDMAGSPMIDALTTAPDRPFTPITPLTQPMERGSLKDALTIAPDRPYSPLPLNMANQTMQYVATATSTATSSASMQQQFTSSEIVKPIVTQTTQMSSQSHAEFTSIQNMSKFQSSSESSAFKPVAKQVFPPPQPDEFCKLTNFPPISNELKTSFAKHTSTSKQETSVSESVTMHSAMSTSNYENQAFSSVKSAQSFFEQLDQKETSSSTAIRSKAGLHKPDSIPPYQKHFEMLPSQRGITPELCNAPAVLQRPVTPTTNPPIRPRDKSVEPKPTYSAPEPSYTKAPQYKPSNQQTQYQQPQYQQAPVQFHKDTPITMTFQPVTDESFLRASPMRSRPTTPSMINKPAPIIPHYQMNLVSVEHIAADTHLFEPSSPDVSRSPTPKPRSRSPAPGPPPNPLKAQAPRIKEGTPQRPTLLSQATSNLRKEHEVAQTDYQNSSMVAWAQDQPSAIKEQRFSNTGFKSENYTTGDFKVKEDSLSEQNYGHREMKSQNTAQYGNTKVQTTKKTFEEFERTQSAKVIEIRKGGSSTSSAFQQIDSNILPSNVNTKQVFPPPVMSLSSSQNSSVNYTNENVTTASRKLEDYQTKPSISGANQGPVCDPTPSTGSSVGAAARGKAFGVASAPKRGRGVLNKAALPGSRVPLCASCNGNIR